MCEDDCTFLGANSTDPFRSPGTRGNISVKAYLNYCIVFGKEKKNTVCIKSFPVSLLCHHQMIKHRHLGRLGHQYISFRNVSITIYISWSFWFQFLSHLRNNESYMQLIEDNFTHFASLVSISIKICSLFTSSLLWRTHCM